MTVHVFFIWLYDDFMKWLSFLFGRRDPILAGESIDLVEERKERPDAFNQYVLTFYYGIYLHNRRTRIGNCDLRVGHNNELYYAGNIGYHIDPPYRGHHYAYEACQLMVEEAVKNQMDYILITCSPGNEASRKTIERLGATYLETTDVPRDHWLYQRGETVKRIYQVSFADKL